MLTFRADLTIEHMLFLHLVGIVTYHINILPGISCINGINVLRSS